MQLCSVEGNKIRCIYTASYCQPYNRYLEDLDLLKTQLETVPQNCAAHYREAKNNYIAIATLISFCGVSSSYLVNSEKTNPFVFFAYSSTVSPIRSEYCVSSS